MRNLFLFAILCLLAGLCAVGRGSSLLLFTFLGAAMTVSDGNAGGPLADPPIPPTPPDGSLVPPLDLGLDKDDKAKPAKADKPAKPAKADKPAKPAKADKTDTTHGTNTPPAVVHPAAPESTMPGSWPAVAPPFPYDDDLEVDAKPPFDPQPPTNPELGDLTPEFVLWALRNREGAAEYYNHESRRCALNAECLAALDGAGKEAV